MRDTVQRILFLIENIGKHFYTYNASPRNLKHTLGIGTSNSIIGTQNCGKWRKPFCGQVSGYIVALRRGHQHERASTNSRPTRHMTSELTVTPETFTKCWRDVGQARGRLTSATPTLGQCLVFAGTPINCLTTIILKLCTQPTSVI